MFGLVCPRAFRSALFSRAARNAAEVRALGRGATVPEADFTPDGRQPFASGQAAHALDRLGDGHAYGKGNTRCTRLPTKSARATCTVTATSRLAVLRARRLAASILTSGCERRSSRRRTSAPPRSPVALARKAAGPQSDRTNDEFSEPVDLSGPDLAVGAQELGDESVEEAADVAPWDGKQRARELAPQQRDNMPRSGGKGRACVIGAIARDGRATPLAARARGRWHRRRLRGEKRTRSPRASA